MLNNLAKDALKDLGEIRATKISEFRTTSLSWEGSRRNMRYLK